MNKISNLSSRTSNPSEYNLITMLEMKKKEREIPETPRFAATNPRRIVAITKELLIFVAEKVAEEECFVFFHFHFDSLYR